MSGSGVAMPEEKNDFATGLRPGQIISNRELMNIFRCACEGGIRPSRTTQTIVLVLNHTKYSHAADWHGDVLWFRGSGARGNQVLDKGRNSTLLTAFKEGKFVGLFEVHKSGQYTWDGPVKLASEPFEQDGPGSDGIMRRVWIFPITLAR